MEKGSIVLAALARSASRSATPPASVPDALPPAASPQPSSTQSSWLPLTFLCILPSAPRCALTCCWSSCACWCTFPLSLDHEDDEDEELDQVWIFGRPWWDKCALTWMRAVPWCGFAALASGARLSAASP